MISEEMIKQFIKLYQEEFGIEISKEEAYEKGMQLLTMMKVIHKGI